jgi:protein-S-isoprenylcysteine O-methyltransferase Ste14
MSAGITVDLMRRDPGLLGRRMKGGPAAEPRPVQRFLVLGTSVGFLGLIVIPALDFRYQWSVVPLAAVVTGDALFVVGFLLIARVYRENTFTSATVSITQGQVVISSGPYAIVRHPMYAGALIYLAGTPPALGSYWGLLALLFMLPFLVWRLIDEEHLLVRELPGYADYCRNVRYRLVPFVW